MEKCIRKDGKNFRLPRKVDRELCLTKDIKGFSLKSSCAPYKYYAKNSFLYTQMIRLDHFDVYIDKNPKDTIPIKYKTIDDVKKL